MCGGMAACMDAAAAPTDTGAGRIADRGSGDGRRTGRGGGGGVFVGGGGWGGGLPHAAADESRHTG